MPQREAPSTSSATAAVFGAPGGAAAGAVYAPGPANAAAAASDAGGDLLLLQTLEQLRLERASQESRLALFRENEEKLNARIEELSESLSSEGTRGGWVDERDA